MKLRCTKNSIRIRIRKSELDQFAKTSTIQESIAFGKQVTFRFELKKDAAQQQVTATFEDKLLCIALPTQTAEHWINTNEVGIEVNHPLDNGEYLHLLIEKDFPCTDREEEDKSDTFWELAGEKPDVC